MSTEALKLARDALEEIALAGMSGTGEESPEAMNAWHARRAREFIGIAARALEVVRAALASPEPDCRELLKSIETACTALAAPAGGAEPVAWQYRGPATKQAWAPADEGMRRWAEAQDDYEFRPLYAAPTAQPQPTTAFMRAAANVQHSLFHDGPGDAVMALRDQILPLLAGALEECGYLPDLQRAAPTLLNGLTEQETAASASVAGLGGAQPEAPWTDPLLGRYAKAVERVESAQPEAPAEPSKLRTALDITLTEASAVFLLEMMKAAEEPAELRFIVGDGHSGYGLYVCEAEYPEEGANFVQAIATPGNGLMKLADEFELRRLLAEERATNRSLHRALATPTPAAQQPAELSIVAGRPNRDAFEVAVSQVLVRWDSELTYTVAQAVSDLMSFLYLDRKAPLGSRAIKAQGGSQ